jgi:hypothetical protein
MGKWSSTDWFLKQWRLLSCLVHFNSEQFFHSILNIMEKGYVPDNKSHHKAKAGSKAKKKDAAQAKKRGVSMDQQKARNPKVRLISFVWFFTI